MDIEPEPEKDGRLETKPANPEGRTVKWSGYSERQDNK